MCSFPTQYRQTIEIMPSYATGDCSETITTDSEFGRLCLCFRPSPLFKFENYATVVLFLPPGHVRAFTVRSCSVSQASVSGSSAPEEGICRRDVERQHGSASSPLAVFRLLDDMGTLAHFHPLTTDLPNAELLR